LFNEITSDLVVQKFYDWKSYSDTNRVDVKVDSKQCVTASQVFKTTGFNEIQFTARAKITVTDTYNDVELVGDRLVDYAKNSFSEEIKLDSSNFNVVTFTASGIMRNLETIFSKLQTNNQCIDDDIAILGHTNDHIAILGDL